VCIADFVAGVGAAAVRGVGEKRTDTETASFACHANTGKIDIIICGGA
jgi:hypothetical protein